ncbi:MAG: metal-dependent transcriptional regulator [Faecalibacterium sp.]
MKILESSENYLETVYILQKTHAIVRAIDIAHTLNYSKASVSIALKHLRENDFVSVDDLGAISLLPKGLAIAESMYERHTVLTSALVTLGVSEEIAAEDACRIEHIISAETFAAIKTHFIAHKPQN